MIKEWNIEKYKFYLLYDKILQPQEVKEVGLSCDDVKKILRQSGALFARWIKEFSVKPTSLWYVVLENFYPLEAYSSRVRTYIRQANRNFVFYRSNKQEFIVQVVYEIDSKLGYDSKNLDSQKLRAHVNSLPQEYEWWILEGKDGKKQGYVLLYIERQQVQVRTIHILDEAKKRGAAYFVNYRLSEMFLQGANMERIIYGLRNLAHRTKVQQWLEEKMFYKKKYVRMEVCLSWKAKVLYYILLPILPLFGIIPLSRLRAIEGFVRYIYLAHKSKKE